MSSDSGSCSSSSSSESSYSIVLQHLNYCPPHHYPTGGRLSVTPFRSERRVPPRFIHYDEYGLRDQQRSPLAFGLPYHDHSNPQNGDAGFHDRRHQHVTVASPRRVTRPPVAASRRIGETYSGLGSSPEQRILGEAGSAHRSLPRAFDTPSQRPSEDVPGSSVTERPDRSRLVEGNPEQRRSHDGPRRMLRRPEMLPIMESRVGPLAEVLSSPPQESAAFDKAHLPATQASPRTLATEALNDTGQDRTIGGDPQRLHRTSSQPLTASALAVLDQLSRTRQDVGNTLYSSSGRQDIVPPPEIAGSRELHVFPHHVDCDGHDHSHCGYWYSA